MKIAINKVACIFLSLLAINNILYAQQSGTYTLPEALQLGLAQSHQLKITAYQDKIAHYAVNEAKLGYAPTLSVSGQATALNQPNIRMNGQNLSNAMSPSSAFFVMGNLSIPVFNGFQLKNNLKIAKEGELGEKEQSSVDSTKILIDIINAYTALYKAEQSKKIIQENLAVANQRVSDFEKLKENGLLSENDFLKAKLQVSKIKLSYIDIDNKYQLASYQLNILLGFEDKNPISTDSVLFNRVFLIENQQNIESILKNRNDFQVLTHKKLAASYAVKLQKNAFYPHINLSAMYLNMNAPNVFSVSNMINAGVSLSYNISDLYKKAPAVSKLKQQTLQLEEQSKIMKEQIGIQVRQAELDYNKENESLKLYQETITQAAENYQDVSDKQKNNLASTTDLLDAELELLQAKINEKLAKADLFLAYCNYLKVTGNLDELKQIK
jgi:outer membrane protein TolC